MIYEPLAEGRDGPLAGETPSSEATSAPVDPNEHFSEAARMERMQVAMLDVMNGAVARGRSLKYWENLRLKPVHQQMLLMKAAGYTNKAIAEHMQYDPARVSVIVNHPDAMYLLSHLISYQAEKLLDVNARIQAHAGEALDTALILMRTGKEEVRERVAFKLLDRAGYGAVQKSETVHKVEMPVAQAEGIATAMREAMDVDRMEEADWEEVESPVVVQVGEPGNSPSESEGVSVPPTSGQLVPTRRSA